MKYGYWLMAMSRSFDHEQVKDLFGEEFLDKIQFAISNLTEIAEDGNIRENGLTHFILMFWINSYKVLIDINIYKAYEFVMTL